MKRKFVLPVILHALVVSAFFAHVSMASAQTVSVRLDPAQTKILWTLVDVLHTVHGTFQLTSGNIVFNTKTGVASGLFAVNEDTGQSGDSTRDGRMKKSILKTAEYPTATFQPTHVTGTFLANGASTLVVDGTFHIYGADHPLQMKFQVNAAGNAVSATTTFGIPYVAWGMHDPSTLFLRVDKVVQMEIDAKGTAQIAP